MPLPARLGLIRTLVEHLEVREVESRPDGAPDERVSTSRARSLPVAGGNHVDGSQAIVDGPERVPRDLNEVCIGAEQFERIPLVVVPHLV